MNLDTSSSFNRLYSAVFLLLCSILLAGNLQFQHSWGVSGIMSNGNDGNHHGLDSSADNTHQQHNVIPLDGQHSYSQQTQQEQGSQDASQQHPLTQQLHQVLVADTLRFWTSTVAPGAQQIAQCTDVLQKEAADLSSRADAEMQGVMDELARVHRLVASFQDQIRETLSMLQG